MLISSHVKTTDLTISNNDDNNDHNWDNVNDDIDQIDSTNNDQTKLSTLSNTILPKIYNNSTDEIINIDRLLEDLIDPCGLWQWFVTIFLMLSSTSIATFTVFANSSSQYRCRMENEIENYIEQNNLSFHIVRKLIGPIYELNSTSIISNLDNGCYRYKENWTTNLFHNFYLSNQNNIKFKIQNQSIELCPYGYINQPSKLHYPNNVVIEFQTLCNHSWLIPFGTSMFIIGMMIGFILGGLCGDKWGRKYSIIIFTCFEFLAALLTSFSTNFTTYTIGRTLMAIGNTGKTNVAHVLLLELTVARYRSLFSATLGLGTNFLYRSLLSLWAYYITNWRWLNLVTMGPNLLGIFYFHLLPESPRWLVSKNKPKKALEILKTGYIYNYFHKNKSNIKLIDNLIIKQNELDQLKQIYEQQNQQFDNHEIKKKNKQLIINFLSNIKLSSILGKSFSSRKLIRTICLCSILIAGMSTCFLGLLFYATTVNGYIYLVAFLNSTTAIPSTILSILLYRFIKKRKKPIMIIALLCLIILIISSLYSILFKPKTDIILIICSNIALILMNTIINMCFVYIPELFPSEIRSHCFGLSLGLGRFCTTLCTIINELDRYLIHGSPLLFYSIVLLFEIGILFFLQDTHGENLPDFIDKNNESIDNEL